MGFSGAFALRKCLNKQKFVLFTGLSLKKTPHVWLSQAKTTFYCCGLQF